MTFDRLWMIGSTGTSCSLIRLVVVKADVRKEKF